MPKHSKSESVPNEMQVKFEEITKLSDTFYTKFLVEEYAQLCRQLTAVLGRKRPSLLATGKANTWTCGIIHALGMINFLFDSSQTLHMKASEIYEQFGVSQSTGAAKYKQLRDLMKTFQMAPDWCLPSKMDNNMMAWMISVNGVERRCPSSTSPDSRGSISKRFDSLPAKRESYIVYQIGLTRIFQLRLLKNMLKNFASQLGADLAS